MTTTPTGGLASARPSGRSKAKTPKATTNGAGKHVEFRGLDLLLPADPPGDLAFSIENNEASAAVQEIFGDAQYVQIREKCKADKLTLTQTFETLRDLLNDCFTEWGLTEGES